MPGLINTHVHLEFSSNKMSLEYGDFLNWLNSVITNRDNLLQDTTNAITKTISKMLKTGTVCIGAVSSYAIDLQAIINSKIRCVYFNEAIGSQANNIDLLFNDFKNRFYEAEKFNNELFSSAIAIHSAYSVHPILLKHIINFINDNNVITSTHFLESEDEKKWLTNNTGNFKSFFKSFFNTDKAITSLDDFIKQISFIKHLLLTHNCYINDDIKKQILENKNFFVTHCPTSNRLLGNKKADFDFLLEKKANIATDGLSSNYSISMFDEMRNALFIHQDEEINNLAKNIIIFATKNAAESLNINSGTIEVNKNADFIILDLPDDLSFNNNIENALALHIILHTKEVSKTFINGKIYFEK
jgi:cytosine/adenosine deaminase-related metal-dependent hydrolase